MPDELQIAAFKAQLVRRQQELRDLAATGIEAAKTVELDQTSVGRLSRMDALQGQAMSRERTRRREIELQKIAAALTRIDTGEFGYCVHCDEEIAIERLALDPSTPLCIRCANDAGRNAR